MNKLYIIRWSLPNGFVMNTSTFWTEDAANEKMRKNPEWEFELVENDDVHMIWEAK